MKPEDWFMPGDLVRINPDKSSTYYQIHVWPQSVLTVVEIDDVHVYVDVEGESRRRRIYPFRLELVDTAGNVIEPTPEFDK